MIEALPDYAYVLRDRSGYDDLRAVFVLGPGSGAMPDTGGGETETGILFSSWSDPDPPLVALVVGPWDSTTSERDLVTGRWSDG